MTITTTKTIATVIASTTQAAGAGPTRGTVDLRTADGGVITFKITNGSTGPTIQCTVAVLVAHNTGSTPTAASAGSDWKTVAGPFGGGSVNNAISEFSYTFGPEVEHLEIEFAGNTGQTVTIEAYISIVTIT